LPPPSNDGDCSTSSSSKESDADLLRNPEGARTTADKVLSWLEQSNLASYNDEHKFYCDAVETFGIYYFKQWYIYVGGNDRSKKILEESVSPERCRAFMQFPNFYWQFIQNFSKVVKALTNLTMDEFKKQMFVWPKRCKESF
jgi:hypothetical protein